MKFLVFIVCLFGMLPCYAQTSFKISKRTFCYYNSATHQPDNCSGATDYTCSFVLSADSTSFDLVFVDSKTHYRVMEKEYDPDNNQYFFKVQSDNGNSSVFQINYSIKAFVIMQKPVQEMMDGDAITVMLIDDIEQ